jgi:hypothetical protein
MGKIGICHTKNYEKILAFEEEPQDGEKTQHPISKKREF